ncbi:MAG: hypothetical protein QM811_06925 [Pirellulales bacterium]
MIRKLLIAVGVLWLCAGNAQATVYMMELPTEVRGFYKNPDGSCVQCSIGMCGAWAQVPEASTLLWDTEYGRRERGGSWPQRVAEYSQRRGIPIYNVTGKDTWAWMRWAAMTNRYAAIGAGGNHFQTLYGWDDNNTPDNLDDDTWYVCNNNSTNKIDSYSWKAFQRLHLASGQWVVILDVPSPPAVPQYVKWW